MVQKNNKWNISKEKGDQLIHKYIIEILKDKTNNSLSLSELIIFLNQRTKHIKFINHNKLKPASVYLRCMYGNIINFIDRFSFYGIIKTNTDIIIKLIDSELNSKLIDNSILNEYKEWILVDEEDFILI
jgi:hypothetical protein